MKLFYFIRKSTKLFWKRNLYFLKISQISFLMTLYTNLLILSTLNTDTINSVVNFEYSYKTKKWWSFKSSVLYDLLSTSDTFSVNSCWFELYFFAKKHFIKVMISYSIHKPVDICIFATSTHVSFYDRRLSVVRSLACHRSSVFHNSFK